MSPVSHVHAVSPERDCLEITFPCVAGYTRRPLCADDDAEEVPRYDTGRTLGRTRDVDFWTARPVREATRCHLN